MDVLGTQPYSEWLRERQCGTKWALPTKREAKRVADRSAAANHEPRSLWRAYRCAWCRLWHVGHVPAEAFASTLTFMAATARRTLRGEA